MTSAHHHNNHYDDDDDDDDEIFSGEWLTTIVEKKVENENLEKISLIHRQ